MQLTDSLICYAGGCGAHQFVCDNGIVCVDEKLTCNGVPDCPDSSDEHWANVHITAGPKYSYI